MTDISAIFHSAIEKDAVGLKSAIDALMTDKAAEAIDSVYADVAASMFGSTVGDDAEFDDSSDETEQEDSAEEEQSDETV